MRKTDNDAEHKLWSELRGRRLNGHKFVRQLPVGPYFADCACGEGRLIVEVDGNQHTNSGHDRKRDSFLREQGRSVLRFWKTDIFDDPRAGADTLLAALEGRLDARVEAFDLRFRTASERGAAPHPPFGHVLPVNEEKE